MTKGNTKDKKALELSVIAYALLCSVFVYIAIKSPLLDNNQPPGLILNETERAQMLIQLAATYAWASYVLLRSKLNPEITRNIAVTAAAVIITSAMLTRPAFTQDTYYNLALVRAYEVENLNPYITTIEDISTYELSSSVVVWRTLPLVQGPLFVWILYGPSMLNTIPTILGATKVLALVFLLLSIKCLWEIFNLHNFTKERAVTGITLFVTSPLVITTTVMDIHSEVFVLLFVLYSYKYLKKGLYVRSLALLTLSALTKYVTILLAPVIFLVMISNSKMNMQTKIKNTLLMVAVAAFLCLIIVLPLTKGLTSLPTGVRSQANLDSMYTTQLLPRTILARLTKWDHLSILVFSTVVGQLVSIYFVLKKQLTFAFITPLITLITLGLGWVMGWYHLWYLPLVLIVAPYWHFVTLTIFSTIAVDGFPSNTVFYGYLLTLLINLGIKIKTQSKQ